MKKLKSKVFLVIYLLLTIFTLIVLVSGLTATYFEKRNSVSRVLTTFVRPSSNGREKTSKRDVPTRISPSPEERRIYLDFTIYTVILDENGKYQEVVNHTSSDEIDTEYVQKIANNIINNHNEKLFIGNLFFDRYSYVFTANNSLIIMDNVSINKGLVNQFIVSLLIFILCEIVIFLITSIITKWIINPVKKSFEKQKTFVADASHELKTPLSVMIASADAYFDDKDDKWVHNMKQESERMIKLVTELLDLAKTEREQDLVMEQDNLSKIIKSSILTFESLFYDKNIHLKYDIESDIHLLCNRDKITELMSILIDNSINHCSSEGEVIVNLKKKNKQITLEVQNTGLPIPKGEEEKIFERFYKVDTSRNRNSNNYGLGLAIAKNIVENHKGKISAHSALGYTTFKIVWNQK